MRDHPAVTVHECTVINGAMVLHNSDAFIAGGVTFICCSYRYCYRCSLNTTIKLPLPMTTVLEWGILIDLSRFGVLKFRNRWLSMGQLPSSIIHNQVSLTTSCCPIHRLSPPCEAEREHQLPKYSHRYQIRCKQ